MGFSERLNGCFIYRYRAALLDRAKEQSHHRNNAETQIKIQHRTHILLRRTSSYKEVTSHNSIHLSASCGWHENKLLDVHTWASLYLSADFWNSFLYYNESSWVNYKLSSFKTYLTGCKRVYFVLLTLKDTIPHSVELYDQTTWHIICTQDPYKYCSICKQYSSVGRRMFTIRPTIYCNFSYKIINHSRSSPRWR